MVDTLAATSDGIRSQLNLGNLPRIAIGHNSYFDLLRDHQNQLSAMFRQEYISAYLCGDKHQRNSTLRIPSNLKPPFPLLTEETS